MGGGSVGGPQVLLLLLRAPALPVCHGRQGTGWEKKGRLFLAWRHVLWGGFALARANDSNWLVLFFLEDCFEGSLGPPLLGVAHTVVSSLLAAWDTPFKDYLTSLRPHPTAGMLKAPSVALQAPSLHPGPQLVPGSHLCSWLTVHPAQPPLLIPLPSSGRTPHPPAGFPRPGSHPACEPPPESRTHRSSSATGLLKPLSLSPQRGRPPPHMRQGK